ncbi:MAG: hypothetical protein ACRCV9_00850 [Burkholderiaceae bacterium]
MPNQASFIDHHQIRIGGITKASLLKELEARGVQLNPFAHELFAHDGFTTLTAQVDINVIQVSVAQLGLAGGGTFDQIIEHALARGYALCPLELGPHFRLQFMHQAEGFLGHPLSANCKPPGSITVASQPIVQSDDVPKGFYLRVIEGVPWLRGYRSWAGHVYASGDVFAFAAGVDTA